MTTNSIQVDELLPSVPDFLKGQIRRMNKGDTIERPKGGKDIQDLTQQERLDRKGDDDFNIEVINDEYTKKLKSKSNENVYLERAY